MITAIPGPDLERVLGPALPRLRSATGLDATMAGPVTLGGGRLVVTQLHGLLTSTMRGLVATPGVGIGGKALQLARPAAVNDYLHSPAVSHHFDHKVRLEHCYAALAVPVRVGRDIRAVLYGMTRTTQPLGDHVLHTAAAVARVVGQHLAVEIEVARRLEVIEQERQHRERRGLTPHDVHEIHEELQAIVYATSDSALRDRLVVLCERMAPAHSPIGQGPPPLTDREREVLTAVAFGRTNHEVAEQLSIMPTTVKTYLKNTMRKLGTRNRVETIHVARRSGLLA